PASALHRHPGAAMIFVGAWLIATAAAQDNADEIVARDAQPLPRYLSAKDITTLLAEQDWQGCVQGGEANQTVRFGFEIQNSGTVSAISITGASGGQDGCWRETLRSVRFGAHDEMPLKVNWTVGVKGGQALPYPVVEVEERRLEPLFIFIKPDATTAEQASLDAALGLSPP
ncbi:MAG: hypothetical protein AAFV53_17750, partial [Myxococcota bacterium]